MHFHKKICISIFLAMMFLWVFCSDSPNPFLDTTKSRATVFSKTFKDRDTVSIFSYDTLSIAIYLKEHLNEVKIRIDHNRLQTSKDTVLPLDSYNGDLIQLPFSFYDTGWQEIEVSSQLHSGKLITEKYSLYAKSPLYQKTVRGKVGDDLNLKTGPVDVKGILYVWDFHNGIVIKDYSNEVSAVIAKNFDNSIGELYVTDNLYKSPSVPFSIETNAIGSIDLVCQNDSIKNDTVFTGQPVFTFKVMALGANNLKSASFNGASFDEIKSLNGSVLMTKTISRIDTVNGPLKVVVNATDNLNRFSEKTFYIHYDQKVTIGSPEIILRIPASTNDTGYVMQSQVALYGEIGGVIDNRMYLQVIRNGSIAGTQEIVPQSTNWTFPVELSDGWNSLQFQLVKDTLFVDSLIAFKTVMINFNPDKNDDVFPVINKIMIDDVAISDEIFVNRKKDALMTILVSDNKMVASVTVNGNDAESDNNNLIFSKELSLVHDKAGVPYVVCVKDSAGNQTCDTVVASYNNVPEIIEYSIPSTMYVDSEYVFTVHGADPDSDSITTTLTLKSSSVDTVLTFLNNSTRWVPSQKDTGALQLKLHLSDPFFESAQVIQMANVLFKSNQNSSLKLKNTSDDFPDTLIVGGSPLSVKLMVDSLNVTPPLTYSVYLKTQSRKIYDSNDPGFVWSPLRSDAGVQTLQVIVHDKADLSDTLTVMVQVIAEAAATVYVANSTFETVEGGENDTIRIMMSNPVHDTVRIPYRFKYTSANSSDITCDSAGTVIFPPGNTTAKLSLGIVDDKNSETDEVLSFTLPQLPILSARDSLVVDQNRAEIKITIKDNDNSAGDIVGVMLQPPKMNLPEMYSGHYPVVLLTDPLPFDLIVTVKPTSNSTATLGSDYSINQKILIKAGQREASLQLKINDDPDRELLEYIELEIAEISNTTDATISEQKLTRVDIIDND